MDYYMHLIPGRIRIRTHAFRRIDEDGVLVRQYIDSIQGVTSVNYNQVAGSVSICYDRSLISSQNIIQELTKKGLFPAISQDSPMGIPRMTLGKTSSSSQISEA